MPQKPQPDPASLWKPVDEPEDTSAWKLVDEPAAPAPQPGIAQQLQHAFDDVTASKPIDVNHGAVKAVNSTLGNLGGGLISLVTPFVHPLETATSAEKMAKALTTLPPLPGSDAATQQWYQQRTAPLRDAVQPFVKTPNEGWEQYAGRLGGQAVSMIPQLAAAYLAPEAIGSARNAGKSVWASVPTRAKAGQLFEHVMSKAQNEPVWMQNSGNELVRARELADRGGTMPTTLRKLDRRVGNVNASPMTYREARDFASNLSRLSSNDTQKLTPVMQRQVGKLGHAFNMDVGDAATRSGVGPEYAQAMRTYARASRNAKISQNLAKWGSGAAATAAGLEGVKSLVHALKK